MEEKFNIGDKVFLVHLQEEGIVTRPNGAEMVYVMIDGMEIPVYCTDITKNLPSPRRDEKRPGNEKKVVKEKEAEIKPLSHGTDSGIFISFEPLLDATGYINQFKVGLVNDTAHPLSFSYLLHTKGKLLFKIEKIALPYQIFILHEIDYDTLNEMPVVELHVKDVMNSFKADIRQKIKPQNFFNKLGKMALTGADAYIYKIDIVELNRSEQPVIRPKNVAFNAELLKLQMMDNPVNKDQDLSSAEHEIDLHIEALAHDHHTMHHSEMLHVQLQKFQQSLERAITSGKDKFYVIHGVGSGKLKKEIHHILKNYPEVKSFNNDYNPSYGYGATEIILK